MIDLNNLKIRGRGEKSELGSSSKKKEKEKNNEGNEGQYDNTEMEQGPRPQSRSCTPNLRDGMIFWVLSKHHYLHNKIFTL